MPRLTQSLPRMREHKPSGRARVTLSKKTFYLGPYGSKGAKREYDKLIAEWLANGRERPPGAKQEAETVTVNHLLAAYWRFAEGYYRKDGRATGELHPIKSALRYVRALYGKLAITEFTPLKLQALRQSMIDNELARSTINSHVKRIVRCFSWGTSQELVPGQLVHALREVAGLRRGRTTARESKPVLPVDDGIVKQTLPFLSPIVADMVRIQRLTGMRPAEVCAMRPCDLDMSQTGWVYSPERHKTEYHGRVRRIPIGPKTQVILQNYLHRDPACYCFSPAECEI